MERELILVHGRSQQGRDPVRSKQEWIAALRAGLAKSDLTLPIPESSVRFPSYGDTLMDLIAGKSGDDVAKIIVRGFDQDAQARAFLEQVLLEVKDATSLTDEQVRESAEKVGEGDVIAMGIQNSRIVLSLLRAINDHLPGVGGAALALATHDVYQYVNNIGLASAIDDGVSQAFTDGRESVVVGHSLGSVVAYNVLKSRGPARGWRVPAFITVGSPLGVSAIRKKLKSVGHPAVVGSWSNAYDPDDIVALRPLSAPWFGIEPAIRNKGDVDNPTDGQHGISGYLGDKEVARWIYDALTS